MKKLITVTVLVCTTIIATSFIFSTKSPSSTSQENEKSELQWYTKLDEAHEISLKTGKPIFGFFTGSDWCGWCHKLQRDVFSKSEFVKWASQEVVLLELDFPKRKQLEPAIKQQNYDLQRAFNVTGYPTVWIFESKVDESSKKMNLNALGKLGYPSGAASGKEEVLFLKQANNILLSKTDGK